MATTIHGLQTLHFAIPEDEAGLVVQRMSVNRRSNKREVSNKDGDIVAVAAGFGARAEISIDGYKDGDGPDADLGAALTLANSFDGNGMTLGVIVLDDANEQLDNGDFVQLGMRATGYSFPS